VTRVLVSDASGINGYGILKSLRCSGRNHQLVGTSTHAHSPANHFSDVFVQAIPPADPAYIDWLTTTIREHRIEIVIPGIEADMYSWAGNVEAIVEAGAQPILNNLELLAICKDKCEFAERLRAKQDPAMIESSLDASFDLLVACLGLPFVVKPRRGYGSRGVVTITDEESFRPFESQLGASLMAQEYVGSDDEEFTVAVFGDGAGGFDASLTLRRTLSRDGYTEAAEVIRADDKFTDAAARLSRFLLPLGPTNFQFRTTADAVKLLEVNPRISSSTSIRAAFGYNEPEMAIDFFLAGTPPAPVATGAGHAVRYIEDIVTFSEETPAP
jgi:carbamoyl-phosphate synthase large subunit